MEKEKSFESYYNAYYLKVLQFIYRRVNSIYDAEDLAQSAFLYCYQHFTEYDEAKASFGTWIYLITSSRIKNYYRDRKLNEDSDGLEILPVSYDFDAAIELEEMRQQIKEALKMCDERGRSIILQKYFEHKTAKEIASAMGMTEGNVRVQLSRNLRKMELYLSKAERN